MSSRPSPEHVVLFADDREIEAAQGSPGYRAAVLRVGLAAAVVGAGARIQKEQRLALEDQVRGEEDALTPSEKRRLQAHVQLVLLERPALPSLIPDLAELTPAERGRVGDFLARVVRGNRFHVPVKGSVGAALLRALAALGLEAEPFLARHSVTEDNRAPLPQTSSSGSAEQQDLSAFVVPEASKGFNACALSLQLASAVLAAGGEIPAEAQERMRLQLHEEAGPTEHQRQQLTALLQRAVMKPPPLAALQARFGTLTQAERVQVGAFLTHVIVFDGPIKGGVLVALLGSFEKLGLSARELFASREDLRARSRQTASARGYRIPAAPSAVECPVSLDPAKVEALHKEQALISALLDPLFQEPPTLTPAAVSAVTPTLEPKGKSEETLLGLDLGASAFLRELLSKSIWTCFDLRALSRTHGLPLDGALERLNEACYERLGVPLFEAGEPLVLNTEALEKGELQGCQ
jgi:hypothetical protein